MTADTEDPGAMTPVEARGGLWLKRDDLFVCNGVRGGKARGCLALAQGAKGLTTGASRQSPQVAIVAAVAQHLGIPAAVHVPAGSETAEMAFARAHGAEIVQHRPGWPSVVAAASERQAKERGWRAVPMGMEAWAAVEATRRQVANLPEEGLARIVIVAGSGTSLAGLLWGLRDRGMAPVVVAVTVGADPTTRLDRMAPQGWRRTVEFAAAPEPYGVRVEADVGGVRLDPVYEAKAARFLRAGDLFWIVGIRPGLAEEPQA